MSYFLSSNTQDNSSLLKPAFWMGYSTENRPTFTNGASPAIDFGEYSIKDGDAILIKWADYGTDFCGVSDDGDGGLVLNAFALVSDLP